MDDKQFRIYLCGGPNCAAAGSGALLRALEDELWATGLDALVEVRVSGCQSRCEHAPNATVWPGPRHYAELTTAALRDLLADLR